MTSKYTPGPWMAPNLSENDKFRPGPFALRYFACDPLNVTEEEKADVRLISAAPDGHKLAEHIDAMANDAYLVGHPEWQEIVDEARALIAKVEGVVGK